MEISFTRLSGIVLISLLTGVGGTLIKIYLEETNKYSNCRGEWIPQENGQFQCTKTLEIQWCYNIENRGGGWYRCYIGNPIKKEKLIYVCDYKECK